jgi:S1-C subfamily serine protease
MKKLLAALLVTAAVTLPAAAADFNLSTFNRQVDETNLLLNKGCSATLVAPDKALTAHHCVEDNYENRVVEEVDPNTGEVRKVTKQFLVPGTVSRLAFGRAGAEEMRIIVRYDLLKYDSDGDLALVRLKEPLKGTPAPIACIGPKRGDVVWAVGNSLGVLYSSVTTGTVSSIDRNRGDLLTGGSFDHRLVQHTAPIAPGNSGGALYNTDMKLIGVNILAAIGYDGLGFAVSTEDVNKFLADQGIPCQ